MKKIILFIFFIAAMAEATNHYVRPNGGSYGDGKGADWTNAFAGMPAGGLASVGTNHVGIWSSGDPHNADSIGPGDTVFISGGTYTTNWEPGSEGTESKPIVILKATTAAHGTSTGWVSTMDTAAHLINKSINIYGIATADCGVDPCIHGWSYITFDGVTGSGRSGYGFIITNAGGNLGNVFITPWGQFPKTGITIRHIEMVGPGKYSHQCDADGINCYGPTTCGHLTSGLTVQYCYIHDFSSGNRIDCKDFLFEDNICEHFDDTIGAPNNCHTNGILMYYSYGTVRRNVFNDIGAEGVSFSDSTGPVYIYANVFSNMGAGVTFQPYNFTETDSPQVAYVYNNTFSNISINGIDVNKRTGQPAARVTIYNNIFFDCYRAIYTGPSTTNDYDWWAGCTDSPTETHGTSGGTVNPFVDTSALNFHIKTGLNPTTSPRAKGKSDLGSPYNIDLDGVTRTGSWADGAYEYIANKCLITIVR